MLLALALLSSTADGWFDPRMISMREIATCIVQQTPGGAQMFERTDGSYQVVAYRPRSKRAVWVIKPLDNEYQGHYDVKFSGSIPGLDRYSRDLCY